MGWLQSQKKTHLPKVDLIMNVQRKMRIPRCFPNYRIPFEWIKMHSAVALVLRTPGLVFGLALSH